MLKVGALLFLAAVTPFAIDLSQFEGIWVGASNQNPDANHSFLHLDKSGSGRFVLVGGGKTIYDFEFSGLDMSGSQGYIELSMTEDDTAVKVLLSGYVSDEDGGAGLLTGAAYMYEATDGRPKLFNTIFLRMRAMVEPMPPYFDSDSAALSKIYERYSAPGAGL